MIKNILFDFDGVIADSMQIRLDGFREIVKNLPEDVVDRFVDYCKEAAGISRYVMFRHLYEDMLDKPISEKEVNDLSERFSQIMRIKMTSPKILIKETISFIKENHKKYNFHIISGSDGDELRYLCSKLGITDFFESILGSPVEKQNNIKDVMKKYDYSKLETIYIGDGKNDYKSAKFNQITFCGYNNIALKEISDFYIESFADFLPENLQKRL
jgi:phosphoglycolate phosphatase-like HAD superfamily hydrolase